MLRYIAFATLTLILQFHCVLAANGIMPGNGTKDNPYLIEDLSDFNTFASNPNYWAQEIYVTLTTDLDLAANGTYSTAVIAPDDINNYMEFDGTPYKGVFNGNKHTIQNLSINTNHIGLDYLGLFGKIDNSFAIIKNLRITNSTIISHNSDTRYAGLLCGWNQGTIKSCSTSGQIITGSRSGGLCGINYSGGNIQFCKSSVHIDGTDYIGGLVGDNDTGTISQSYATGSVSGDKCIGGLCGINYTSGKIMQCYSTGYVSGRDYVAGFCGLQIMDGSEMSDCFWDIQTSLTDKGYHLHSSGGPVNNVTGKTTSEMQSTTTYTTASWDFSLLDGDDTEWYLSANSYPILYWEHPLVVNGETLVFLPANQQNTLELSIYCSEGIVNWTLMGYERATWISNVTPIHDSSSNSENQTVLTIQIDSTNLSPGIYQINLALVTPPPLPDKFIPITLSVTLPGSGTESDPFTINNFSEFDLFCNPINSQKYWSQNTYTRLETNIDLNPNLPGRKTYNQAVIAPDIFDSLWIFDAQPFSGIFDGNNHIIRNMTINTYSNENDYLGLFGKIYGSEAQVKNLHIIDSSIDSKYNSESFFTGLLCGWNQGIITNCSAAGSIYSGKWTGGLCGINYTDGIIQQCCSSTHVNGYDIVGGMAGDNDGYIYNCFATGNIYGFNSVGSFCGTNDNHAIISKCYSTGITQGQDNVAGFCGLHMNETAKINACFWDKQTTQTTIGFNLDTPDGINFHSVYGITTDEMTTKETFTFVDWDFTSTDGDPANWQINPNAYPTIIGITPAWNRLNLDTLSDISRFWMTNTFNNPEALSYDYVPDHIINIEDVLYIANNWLDETF